jgi:hypothetical protein
MVFSIPRNDTITHVVSDDEFDEHNKLYSLQSTTMLHQSGRGSNGHLTMQRRGSNGTVLMPRRGSNGNSLNHPITRNNSMRDKLTKFKDASFRRSMRFTNGSKHDSFSDQLNNSFHLSGPFKRKVCFAHSTENEIHEIESFRDIPKAEIWWSMEELASSRSQGQVQALTDSSVQRYITVFDQAQRQVHIDRKLPSDCLRELVKYLTKGYLGLEGQYNTEARIESIRDHVASVVRYYREQLHDESNMTSFSESSQSSVITSPTCGNDVRDRNVRNYASKLSAGNRHFAVAMGNAIYLASSRDSRSNMESGQSSRKFCRQVSM